MGNLQDGITAFKSGNKDEARRCFIIAVKEDPNNENVWGWLYQVTKNDKEKIECLNKIIAINPNNEKARQALERFLAPPAPVPPMKNIVSPVPNPPPYSANVERLTPPSTEVPKKNNNWIWIAIASSFLIVCCLCLAISLNTDTTSGFPAVGAGTPIKYVISGSAQTALVTYFNEQGGTEQVNVNLPFTKEMNVPIGAALSLVAQNGGSGSITCEIWIDGVKKKSSTSTAQYGVVTCTDFNF